MRQVFIAINGIRTNPGDADGWTDRFVTWIHTRTPDGTYAEKFEYYCSALLRRVHQRERAGQIAAKVGYYRRSGHRVVLVGHSNGCDLIARVLMGCGQEIDAAHLLAPATDGEMFDEAILSGVIRRIHIYGSANDEALKFARNTRKLIGWCGLGYGYLGLQGRDFEKRHPHVVRDHSNDEYGHITWFARGPVFESTMQKIVANDREDVKSLPVILHTP